MRHCSTGGRPAEPVAPKIDDDEGAVENYEKVSSIVRNTTPQKVGQYGPTAASL